MQAEFYEYKKLPNSTAQPHIEGQSPRVTLDVRLKDETSMTSPVIVVDTHGEASGTPGHSNYAYIQDLGNRFYFIQEWTQIANYIWEASLKVDVLATYRDDIRASTQMVERSAVAADRTITDALAVGTCQVVTTKSESPTPWNWNNSHFVVEAMGRTGSGFYVMTPTGLSTFLSNLFSDSYAAEVAPNASIFDNVRINVNPLQYIGSARLYPFYPTAHGGNLGIPVGWGSVPGAYPNADVESPTTLSVTLYAKPHPQGLAFLNREPFSTYELFFPPFGSVPLDAGVIWENDDGRVECDVLVDVVTGVGILYVYAGAQLELVGTSTAKIGVDLKIGNVDKVDYGWGDMALAMLTPALSLATGNIIGAISSTAASIQSYSMQSVPRLRQSGTNGGRAGFKGSVFLYGQHQRVKLPYNTRCGSPVYTYYTMSTLSGYTQCSAAAISIAGFEAEAREIENYMNGGFYLV